MSEERTLRRSPRISKKRKLNEPYESSKKQKNDDSNEFKLPYNVARNPVEAKEKAIKMLSDCKKEKSIARIFGGMGSNFYFKKKINNKIGVFICSRMIGDNMVILRSLINIKILFVDIQ